MQLQTSYTEGEIKHLKEHRKIVTTDHNIYFFDAYVLYGVLVEETIIIDPKAGWAPWHASYRYSNLPHEIMPKILAALEEMHVATGGLIFGGSPKYRQIRVNILPEHGKVDTNEIRKAIRDLELIESAINLS